MKNVDWGWQGKARKIRMRGEHLFRNLPIPADVIFKAENKDGVLEDIPAHRLIMGIGSGVLYAMFYGPNANSQTGEVTIDILNYTAEVFRTVVEFLYSDRTPNLSMENAMDVLRCADQYGIPQLVTRTRAFVLNTLRRGKDPDHILRILTNARDMDDVEVARGTMDVVVRFAKSVLSCQSFEKLSLAVLDEIVQCPDLRLGREDEIILYRAVHRWAKQHQAEEASEGLPRRTLREILGPTFNLIRFPMMSHVEIADGPLKDRLFSLEEITDVFRYQFSPVDPPALQFPVVPRIFRPTLSGVVIELVLPDNLKTVFTRYGFAFGVELFSEGVDVTAKKFRQLCARNYSFDIYLGSTPLALSTQPDGLQAGNEILAEPIPNREKVAYIHDFAGTVALRRCDKPAADGIVGRYCLDISFGKKGDELDQPGYTGVVCGRLIQPVVFDLYSRIFLSAFAMHALNCHSFVVRSKTWPA